MSCRASSVLHIEDKWVAYQLDSCITFIGITLENALGEMVKVGSDRDGKLEHKYNIKDLLKPDFRLPRPPTEKELEKQAINWYKSFRGRGIKWFKSKPLDTH